MEAPQYQAPPIDPQFATVKARAEQDKITAIQASIGQDSASLLARYGKMQAVSAAGGVGAAASAMPLYSMSALGGAR